jgi:sterol 3beta-glucosyltransferase
VDTAIQSIYRDLEYAKSLIKRKDGKAPDDNMEDSEESWTFIGDDNDPELIKRIQDWDGVMSRSIYAGGSRVASTSSTVGNRGPPGGPGVPASRTAV